MGAFLLIVLAAVVLAVGVDALVSAVSRHVWLAPAVTIAAQVFMGMWFGAAGFILATPFTVVAMVVIHKLYLEAALGDRARPSGE